MSDRRPADQPADPQRVVRDLLADAERALAQGRPAEAASTLQAALGLCERIPNGGLLSVDVVERLAGALQGSGRRAEALDARRRLAALYEAHRPHDPRFAAVLASLALLCDDAGRKGEADGHLARAVALVEAKADEDPIAVAQAATMGDALVQHGERLDVAERLLRKALRGMRAAAPPEAPELGDLLVVLAELMIRTDRDDEALALLEEGLPILEAATPPRERLGLGLMHLGRLRLEDDRLDEAEELLRRSEDVYAALLGPRSPEALGSRYQRGIVCREQGKDEEAETIFAYVLKEVEAVLGPDNPAVANIAEAYAELLDDLGREEEAAALTARVEAIRGADEES